MNPGRFSRIDNIFLKSCGWLLGLYPADFRDEFGRAILQAVQDEVRDSKRSSFLRRINFWVFTLADLVLSAAMERITDERSVMKTRNKILNGIGIGFVLYWFIMFGWSLLRAYVGRAIADPFMVIMGETPSNFVRFIVEEGLFFGPMIALLVFCIPLLSVERGNESGEFVLIRVRKARVSTLVFLGVSILITAFTIGVRLFQV